jgi:hypothetical protein
MLCDKYKEALIEVAASGAALPGGLREHVEVCAICGARLAAERTLFAAIDDGLHKGANAKVRSSFLPNVKANLATETVPTGNPIPGWAFLCAAGALALAAAFLSVPRGARDRARTEGIIVPSRVPAGASGVGLSLPPERTTRYSARVVRAPGQKDISGATSHEAEVLIQPEEEEFLRRWYAAVHNSQRYAKAVVTDDHEVTPPPLVIEQIEVRDLKIENLDEDSGLAQTGTK